MQERRICIVDDEEAICEILALSLDDDFDVVTFSDPRQAVTHLESQRCCLLITDVKMPNISGLELVKRIRGKFSSLPVLIISGHGINDSEVSKAATYPNTKFLPKPFDNLGQVRKAVDELLNDA